MSPSINSQPIAFNFESKITAGLFICAGGFEDRATAFVRRLQKRRLKIESTLILHYESQQHDNESGFQFLCKRLAALTDTQPCFKAIHADFPVQSCLQLAEHIHDAASKLNERSAIIDISGMTHLWALASIHACMRNNLQTTIVYTESKSYYPPKDKRRKVVKAWQERDYESASPYLQSAGLGSVQILPEFSGNFRPGKQTCLMLFVGHEPNRIEGLVDSYAPSAVVVFYGVSPRKDFDWRTKLSKDCKRHP